mgnify:CR=1 FL=1
MEPKKKYQILNIFSVDIIKAMNFSHEEIIWRAARSLLPLQLREEVQKLVTLDSWKRFFGGL